MQAESRGLQVWTSAVNQRRVLSAVFCGEIPPCSSIGLAQDTLRLLQGECQALASPGDSASRRETVGGTPCAVPALCEKSAVFQHR